MNPKVVIIGEYENNRLAMIRSLGEIGYDISVVVLGNRKKRELDSYSKYVSNYYLFNGNDASELFDYLMNNCKDDIQKVILIPVGDFSALLLDKIYNKLKDYFLLPNIHEEQGAIAKWMKKDVQKAHALKCGLNVVDSKAVDIVGGCYTLPVGIKYPCFTKIQSYIRGAKKYLRKCNDEVELIKTLNSISKQSDNISVIIEDFKEIDHECAVVGFSDGKDVIIPGIIEIQTIANGVAMTGKVVPTNGHEELLVKFKNFVREIGFIGLFDIDFFYSGNESYFCELNLRYGGSGYTYTKTGVNLPEMFVRSLRGICINDMNLDVTKVSSFVNEKVCLKTWYIGKMTTKDYLHIMESSDLFIYRDDSDPIPGQLFEKRMKELRLRRFIRRVVKEIVVR